MALLARGNDVGMGGALGNDDFNWAGSFYLIDEDGRRVEDPKQARKIRCGRSPMIDERWVQMGVALKGNSVLRQLHLIQCDSPSLRAGIMSLFGGEHQCSYPLEVFKSEGNLFDHKEFCILLRYLQDIPTLRTLCLNGANLGGECINLLSEAFARMQVTTLQLEKNEIRNDDLKTLLSVESCLNLEELSLSGNRLVERGCGAIVEFLGRNDTRLRSLDVSDSGIIEFTNSKIDGECAKKFIQTLPKNSKLEVLNFGNPYGSNSCSSIEAGPELHMLVCNTSSIKSLCQSNHFLHLVNVDQQGTLATAGRTILKKNPNLQKAFGINARGATVNKRIRSKLRAFYFKGHFDVQQFLDWNIGILPYVLDFITMSEVYVDGAHVKACKGNLDGVYRLIQQVPSLLHFTSMQVESQQLRAKVSSMEMELMRLRKEIDRLRSVNCCPANELGYNSKRTVSLDMEFDWMDTTN